MQAYLNINLSENFQAYQCSSHFKQRIPLASIPVPNSEGAKPFKVGTLANKSIKDICLGKPAKEVFFTESQLRTHLLVSGSSDSCSQLIDNLLQYHISSKNPSIYLGNYSYSSICDLLLARSYDPQQVRVVVLGTQPEELKGYLASIDPFEDMSISDISELLVQTDAPNTSELLNLVLDALFTLRDSAMLALDVATIQLCLTLEGIAYLTQHPHVSKPTAQKLTNYLLGKATAQTQQNLAFSQEACLEHEQVTQPLQEALQTLQQGYDSGCFSVTPTESIRDTITHHKTLYIALNQPENDLLVNLINQKLSHTLNECTSTDKLKSIIIQDITPTKKLANHFMTARAKNYSLTFATSNPENIPEIINSNTANKLICKINNYNTTAQHITYTLKPNLLNKLINNNPLIKIPNPDYTLNSPILLPKPIQLPKRFILCPLP